MQGAIINRVRAYVHSLNLSDDIKWKGEQQMLFKHVLDGTIEEANRHKAMSTGLYKCLRQIRGTLVPSSGYTGMCVCVLVFLAI